MKLTRIMCLSSLMLVAITASAQQSASQLPKEHTTRTKVALLGTGTPVPDPDRSGPATAIVVDDSVYLVDFGPGVVRRAKAALDRQRSDYKETDVAQVTMAHRPGELARAASRLGDAGININYGYCRTEAVASASILIFGGRCRCDSGVFLPEVCIDYAGDVLSEPLLDGEDLG